MREGGGQAECGGLGRGEEDVAVAGLNGGPGGVGDGVGGRVEGGVVIGDEGDVILAGEAS